MSDLHGPNETYYDFRTDSWSRVDPLSPRWSKSKEVAVPAPSMWTGPAPRDLRLRLGVLFVGLAVPGTLLSIALPVIVDVIWVFILIPIAIVALQRVRWLGEALNWASAEDENLIEDPADPNGWLVQIHVIQDGVVTGKDRGVLWFDSDAVCFTGHACSFVVGTQDLPPRVQWGEYGLGNQYVIANNDEDPSWFKLPLRLPRKRLWLGIRWLYSPHHPKRDRRSLQEAMANFRQHAKPTEAPRQYPPLDAQENWRPS